MCTSPLVRFRPKRMIPLDSDIFGVIESYDRKTLGFKILSQKKLESYFNTFGEYLAYMDTYFDYITIPCGKCEECRKKYAVDWSVRCYHESLFHSRNCFITLTFDSLANKKYMEKIKNSYKNGTNRHCKRCKNGNKYFNYPLDYSLNKSFILDWLKSMRDYLYRKYNVSIRYFGAGEYGSLHSRPHYHFLIFGWDFPNIVDNKGKHWTKTKVEFSKKGVQMFVSSELQHLWPYGNSYIEDLNIYACQYVAKYCMKKIKFFDREDLYDYYSGRLPEFLVMSKGNCQANRCPFIDDIISLRSLSSLRDIKNPFCKNCSKTRGGLGFEWFNKYFYDLKKRGFIVIDGKKYPIPEYYKKLINLTDKNFYDKLRNENIYYVNSRLEDNPDEFSTERLKVRKDINKKKLQFYGSRSIN